MASNIAPAAGNPFDLIVVSPEITTDGFVGNVGTGVKAFVQAFKIMAKYYGRYRPAIAEACKVLNSVPPVTDPPLGDKILAALDAVFALAPQINLLDHPGAG